MSKLTQKEILIRTLNHQANNNSYFADQWIISYNLIKVNTPFGWLGTSADSLARAARQEGLIESKDSGQYVSFRITDKGREWLRNKESAFTKEFQVPEKPKSNQGMLL